VITIDLPPLRAREGDVALLAGHFLQQQGGRPKRLSAAALAALTGHNWPGNVRELRNTMQRAVALSEGDLIEPVHLGLAGVVHPAPGLAVPELAAPAVIDWDGTLEAAIASLEACMLARALAAASGNRSEAARRLGLSRQQLYRKLDQHGLA
jgi:DNA-binding NtrC family response regulator